MLPEEENEIIMICLPKFIQVVNILQDAKWHSVHDHQPPFDDNLKSCENVLGTVLFIVYTLREDLTIKRELYLCFSNTYDLHASVCRR